MNISQPFAFAFVVAAVLHLSITPSVGAVKEERYLFAASEAEGNLAVIDLTTEKVVKVLPTGKVPHAMAMGPDGKFYINNRGSSDLTVIDGMTAAVSTTVPLPAISFQLATSPDGKTLAVVYKNALTLTLVDTKTDKIVRSIDIALHPNKSPFGSMMKHPTWSVDGKAVYVTDSVNQNVVKVGVDSGKVVKTFDIKGATHYLHHSPGGKSLYAVNQKVMGEHSSLTLIDTATDVVVKEVPVPMTDCEKANGHHGAFTRDGLYFLFCNASGHTVSVFDVAKREFVKTIKVGTGPGHAALSPDGKQFFIVHHRDSVITILDVATMEVVKTIKIGDVGKQSHTAWFTPDGGTFYVVSSGDNILVKIDVRKLEVTSSVPVPPKTMFFAIRDGSDFPPTEY